MPRLGRYLKSRLPDGGPKPAARRAHEVVDNAFLVSVIAPLSAAGWYVTYYCNGPCTPGSARGCLEGWPNHPVDDTWRLWWLSVGGLYTAEMVGTFLGGVGFKLSLEMMVHHVVTMMLMVRPWLLCCGSPQHTHPLEPPAPTPPNPP